MLRHPPHASECVDEVDVMSSLIATSMGQYAVISVRTMLNCERSVIAYSDEKTLRDLLAAPSIVALGYSSRQEAQAGVYGHGTISQPLQHKLMATLVTKNRQTLREFVSNHLRLKDKFSFGKTQNAFCGLLRCTFIAAVVLFYSKNVLSAVVRALISF